MIKENSKSNLFTTRELVLISLFTALIAVGAFIKIPIPLVPLTLQVFFVTLAGALLGARAGATSVLLYVLLGLAGVPIFTQGGGPQYIFVPTFGYLIAYIFGAYFVGYWKDRGYLTNFKNIILVNTASLLIIYIIGVAYLFIISNLVINAPVSLATAIKLGAIVCFPADFIKLILAASVTLKVNKAMNVL